MNGADSREKELRKAMERAVAILRDALDEAHHFTPLERGDRVRVKEDALACNGRGDLLGGPHDLRGATFRLDERFEGEVDGEEVTGGAWTVGPDETFVRDGDLVLLPRGRR